MIWDNTTLEESKESGINGLYPKNFPTSAVSIKDFESKELGEVSFEDLLKKLPSYQFFICYLDYAVVIGKKENGNPLLPPSIEKIETKFIQKIRIFNKEEEVYFWRTTIDGKRVLKGRHRKDNNGELQPVVEANQILFGTTSTDLKNGFTKLTEDRGTEVILPFTNIDIDNKDKRMAIRTRNYIGYNEIGQAGYVDCRFVEFVKRDKDNTYTWDEVKKVWVME